MSDDDDERAAALAKHLQAASHELRANALSLVIGSDSHRRQSHPRDSSRPALGHHRREQNMTDNAIVDRDQRQRLCARLAQLVDEIGFRRLLECQLVDPSNRGNVFRSFLANCDHGCPFYWNERSIPRRLDCMAIEVVHISHHVRIRLINSAAGVRPAVAKADAAQQLGVFAIFMWHLAGNQHSENARS